MTRRKAVMVRQATAAVTAYVVFAATLPCFSAEKVDATGDAVTFTAANAEIVVRTDAEPVVRFAAKEHKVVAWLTFEAKGLIDVRRELYNLTSKIDKCFVINSDSICPQP